MKFKIVGVLTICTYFLTCDCGHYQNYNVYWERVEDVPSKAHNVVDASKLRIIRIDKVRYFNGTIVFNADLDNTFKIGMKTSYSPRGDSQFLAQPYTFVPTEFCDFYNTNYKKFGEPIFKNKSNLPIVTPAGICPLKQGQYEIKNAELVSDSFPLQANPGLFRLDIAFTNRENKYVGGFLIFMRIESKVPAIGTG